MFDKENYFLLSKIAANVGQFIDAEHWALPLHFKDNRRFEEPSSFCFWFKRGNMSSFLYFFIASYLFNHLT